MFCSKVKELSLFAFFVLVAFPLSSRDLDPSKKDHLYFVKYGKKFRHTMDVVLPKNRSKEITPVVVFIHGGAWIMGDKITFLPEAELFADSGVASISINYRYASNLFKVHHPDLIQDVRMAIDFIDTKSDEWDINTNLLGVVGHSAGGHLALLTAYLLNDEQQIKTCVSWAGPLDFLDEEQRSITGSKLVAKTYTGSHLKTASDTLLYKDASPYWTASSTSIPTLLVYATEDIGVPYSNATRFKQRLDELEVESELIELTGSGHIFIGDYLDEARYTTLEWMKDKLKPSGGS